MNQYLGIVCDAEEIRYVVYIKREGEIISARTIWTSKHKLWQHMKNWTLLSGKKASKKRLDQIPEHDSLKFTGFIFRVV